jgi:hypothetical protein
MESILQRPADAAGVAYWSARLPTLGLLGMAASVLASDELYRLVQGQAPPG